jgi:hypothetical protein
MHPLMSLVAASAVSISAGWTRLPDGSGYEYIIQIEPEAIASLVDGEEFISEVPPDAREVRSYRVRVGRQQLPRESGPLTSAIGPPPTDTTLNLGPPPDAAPAAPNFVSPPAAPEITHRPAAEPRHVGIHAEVPKGAEDAGHPANHEADKISAAGGAGPSAPTAGSDGAEPVKKMWAPLFGALLALFASVGGNVFLGWTAVNMRGRYKALLAHQQLA